MVRHKKQIIDLDTGVTRRGASASLTGTVMQESARSDRPGFVVEERTTGDGKWQEVVEFYAACGLPLQHEFQQSLLARCHNVAVAVSVVTAAARLLGVAPRRTTINFSGDTARVSSTVALALKQGFITRLEEYIEVD